MFLNIQHDKHHVTNNVTDKGDDLCLQSPNTDAFVRQQNIPRGSLQLSNHFPGTLSLTAR